jgi:hypothetical protein
MQSLFTSSEQINKRKQGLGRMWVPCFLGYRSTLFGLEAVWSRNPKAWGTTEIRVHEPTVKGKA